MKRIVVRVLVFGVLALFLGACGGRDFYSEGTATTRADEAMLETIQRAFWEDDGVDESDLTIRVDRSNVSVSGRISNTEEKKRILTILRAVDGIGEIDIGGLTRR